MNITLKEVFDQRSDYNTIIHMMYNEEGICEIFNGKADRVLFSPKIFIICVDQKEVGFIYFVNEKVEDMFFVDMGLLKKYRGLGIGKKVLQMIHDKNYKDFLIGETKKDNVSANEVTKECGVLIGETEDRNFYLLQKERVEEFIESNGFEKLSKKFQYLKKVK